MRKWKSTLKFFDSSENLVVTQQAWPKMLSLTRIFFKFEIHTAKEADPGVNKKGHSDIYFFNYP